MSWKIFVCFMLVWTSIFLGIAGDWGRNSRIEKLEEQVTFLEEIVNTRMVIERDRFNMLNAEVGYHSTYWVQQSPWKRTDLDKFRDYREAWKR